MDDEVFLVILFCAVAVKWLGVIPSASPGYSRLLFAQDAVMSDQWYIKTTNGKRGPYTMKQLQRYVDAGAIRPNAGIGDGEGQWVAAATVGGLTFSPEVIAKLRSGIQAAAKSSNSAPNKASERVQQKEPASNTAASNTAEVSADPQSSHFEARADELNAKAAALDDQNAKLESRSSELESMAAKLEQQQSDLQEQATEIQSQREAIDAEQQTLEAQAQDAEQAAVDLEQKSAEFESRSKELDERAAAFEVQREEWEASQVKAEADSQSDLETQLAGLREELETAQQQQETSDEKVTVLESEKAELTQRLEALETKAGVDQKALEEREEALIVSQAELETAQAEYQEKQAQLQSQIESIAKEREDVDTNRAMHESRGEELKRLTEELDRREESLDEQTALLSERETEIEQRQSELDRCRREFDSAREGQGDGSGTASVLATGAVAAAGVAAATLTDTKTEEADSLSSAGAVELAELRAELASARLLIEEKETQLAQLETQLDEARKESSKGDEGAAEISSDAAAVATEVSPESILEEKRKLLRQFALRQESLSRREAELISREEELTERELSIAKIKADALPQGSLHHDSVTPDDVEEEKHHEDSFEQTDASIGFASDDDVSVGLEEAADILHDSAIVQEPEHASSTPEIELPETLLEPDPPVEERLLPQETPEIMEAWPALEQDASDLLTGDGKSDSSEDALQDWLEIDDETSAKDRLPSEEYVADSPNESFSRWPSPKRLSNVDETAELSVGASDGSAGEASSVSRNELSQFRKSVYEQRFGKCDRYVADDDPAMKVDLSIHLPFGARDFTTVVTSGMSDYPIPMPNGQRSVRAELVLYSTQVDDLAMEVIRAAAKVPFLKKQGLSIGSTCSLADGGFTNSSGAQQDAVFMMPIIEDDSTPIQAKELVENSIQLFWLVTITQAERKLIETQGIHKFLGMLEKYNHTRYFDPTRECYVKRKGWFRR